MPEVVFIHGVGESPGPGPAESLDAWITPLAAPVPASTERWLRNHSAMVYYQDWDWYADEGLADRRSERTWATMRETISAVVEEARDAFDAVDPDGLADLVEVATRFSESEGVLAASNRVADQMSAFNMWQVAAFLSDLGNTRSEILQRVRDVITTDTRVVIAHSLGSVVAYEAAHEFHLQLDALITLGSPLGIPAVVLDRLRPPGRFPSGVAHWVNIAHPNEPVANTPRLAPLFASDDDRTIDDLIIDTGGHYPWHAIETYLSRDEARRAIWHTIGLKISP